MIVSRRPEGKHGRVAVKPRLGYDEGGLKDAYMHTNDIGPTYYIGY